MPERDETTEALSYRINAVNLNKLELSMNLIPGAPDNLEEAAARAIRGEPFIKEEPEQSTEKQ